MEKGNPVLTKTGQANTVIPVRYLADRPTPCTRPGGRKMRTRSTRTSRRRSRPG